ncbi:thiopurine S-methyltransferase [Fodinibius sp. Rm-B-1B1-1]|uniref:thiopurine S-methyltransferase n=1 Tax=Fodinibius alkaliphilus TaxID=3140241 RepID=UPI00315A6DFB
MEISYWQSRWRKDNTGWHMDMVYPPLPKLWKRLNIKSESRILVPLCGKSLDLHWLAEHSQKVIGVDVSHKALHTVMEKYPETFSQTSSHNFTVYKSSSLELWEGDFMKLPTKEITPIDLVYDKASIIALPPKMRPQYAQKILDLCGNTTRILLQTFEYIQEEMNGPPFSVDEKELQKLFGHNFRLQLMHEQSKLEELEPFQQRGLSSYLTEQVFYLTPLNRD